MAHDRIVRRKLQFNENRHLVDGSRRLAQSDLDALDASHVLSRAKVLGLSQLALVNANYSKGGKMFESWEADALAEPERAGELLLAGGNWTASVAKSRALWDLAMREATAVTGASWGFFDLGDRLKEGTGVASLLFTRGADKILVFRHTYSTGDYSNINSWLTATIVDKARLGATTLIKRSWVDVLGLPWTAEMEARAVKIDLKQRLALKVGSRLLSGIGGAVGEKFVANLVAATHGKRIAGYVAKPYTRYIGGDTNLLKNDGITRAAAEPRDCYALCRAWNLNASNALNPCTHFTHLANPLKNDGTTPKCVLPGGACGPACYLKGGPAYEPTSDVGPKKFTSGLMPQNPAVKAGWKYADTRQDKRLGDLAPAATPAVCFSLCLAWTQNASNALRPCTHFNHKGSPVQGDGVTPACELPGGACGPSCRLLAGPPQPYAGSGEADAGPNGFVGGVMPNSVHVKENFRYKGGAQLEYKAAATAADCYFQCVAWNQNPSAADAAPCTHWTHVQTPVKSDGVTDKYGWGATCFLKSGGAIKGAVDYGPKGFISGIMQTADTARFAGTPTMALTADEAKKQGYWPVTKAITDAVYQSLNGGRLLLAGYSQGGARAQLARMYLEKKYSFKPPVVTFAAVGTQCFPRKLYDGGSGRTNFLDDVDPTKAYGNVTDYTHPLDPYGSNLGPDIGTTCYLGSSDIQTSAAKKYCGRVYGNSAPAIYYDANVVGGPLKSDFRICKYYTHSLMAIQGELNNSTKLFADGTTDGGCIANALIPNDGSPADTCPQAEFTNEEMAALAGIIVLILLFVGFVCTCCFKLVIPKCCPCLLCCCCKDNKEKSQPMVTKSNEKHVV